MLLIKHGSSTSCLCLALKAGSGDLSLTSRFLLHEILPPNQTSHRILGFFWAWKPLSSGPVHVRTRT